MAVRSIKFTQTIHLKDPLASAQQNSSSSKANPTSFTQNIYIDLKDSATAAPKNLNDRTVVDAKSQLAAAKAANSGPERTRKNQVLWLLAALSIIGLLAGLSISLVGATTANPLLTQVGTLMYTTFSAITVKVVDRLLSDLDEKKKS